MTEPRSDLSIKVRDSFFEGGDTSIINTVTFKHSLRHTTRNRDGEREI